MGRKGPRAKTKIVLKSVSKVEQLGSMPNLKFRTFLNKNHPTTTTISNISINTTTNISNFTTDIVRLDQDTSEMEIKMNVSKMRVNGSFFSFDHLISDHLSSR